MLLFFKVIVGNFKITESTSFTVGEKPIIYPNIVKLLDVCNDRFKPCHMVYDDVTLDNCIYATPIVNILDVYAI